MLTVSSNLSAQILFSEVLSNEPEGRVRLEWVEIYNESDTEVNLGDYIFISDSDINQIPNGIFLEPYSYAILARQAIPADGSDSFEGHWGDSSGVWGDHESENFPLLDVAMTLNNNSGNIRIENTIGLVLDEFSWDTASDDGRSVERDDVGDVNSGWHDCFDPDGSTPGRANSAVPSEGESAFHVEIDPVVISNGDGNFENFTIDVIIPPATELTVRVYDETGYMVNELVEDSEANVLQLSWDGRDASGGMLSPGIYIIAFDLSGRRNETKTRPVVIAP